MSKKFLISLTINFAIFSVLLMPTFSSAVLVPCGVTDTPTLAVHPDYARPCDFNALMDLINIIIHFILFNLAVPIAAIMFAYAGFLLITAQGGEAKTKAKNIFTNAVLGLVFAAAAYLIIRTLLSVLGYKYTGVFF